MKLSIISTFILIVLNGCSPDDSQSLPPATQSGANTVGCLINGDTFLPQSEGLSPSVNCFYQLVDDEWYFSLSFSDRRGSINETVSVFTVRIILEEGFVYPLDKPDTPTLGGGGEYRQGQANQFNTSTEITGELFISHLDLENSIISGTFWFDAMNEAGELIEIREGRFDWDY